MKENKVIDQKMQGFLFIEAQRQKLEEKIQREKKEREALIKKKNEEKKKKLEEELKLKQNNLENKKTNEENKKINNIDIKKTSEENKKITEKTQISHSLQNIQNESKIISPLKNETLNIIQSNKEILSQNEITHELISHKKLNIFENFEKKSDNSSPNQESPNLKMIFKISDKKKNDNTEKIDKLNISPFNNKENNENNIITNEKTNSKSFKNLFQIKSYKLVGLEKARLDFKAKRENINSISQSHEKLTTLNVNFKKFELFFEKINIIIYKSKEFAFKKFKEETITKKITSNILRNTQKYLSKFINEESFDPLNLSPIKELKENKYIINNLNEETKNNNNNFNENNFKINEINQENYEYNTIDENNQFNETNQMNKDQADYIKNLEDYEENYLNNESFETLKNDSLSLVQSLEKPIQNHNSFEKLEQKQIFSPEISNPIEKSENIKEINSSNHNSFSLIEQKNLQSQKSIESNEIQDKNQKFIIFDIQNDENEEIKNKKLKIFELKKKKLEQNNAKKPLQETANFGGQQENEQKPEKSIKKKSKTEEMIENNLKKKENLIKLETFGSKEINLDDYKIVHKEKETPKIETKKVKRPISAKKFIKNNNIQIITNAIKNVCLAGEANKKEREMVLLKIKEESDQNSNLIIAFKGILGRQVKL